MKKVNLEYIYGYPKDKTYSLANRIGRQLLDYLGEDQFLLLIDSKILLSTYGVDILRGIRDKTWKLHPAAKSLEAFLKK